MRTRHRLFQRILLAGPELTSAQALHARHIGLAFVRERLLFVTGMSVASVAQRPCVYYPYLGQIHVQGAVNFGYMLTKAEYRKLRAEQAAAVSGPLRAQAGGRGHGPLFASNAGLEVSYAQAA